VRRLRRRPRLSNLHRHRAFPRCQGVARRAGRYRYFLLRPCSAELIAQARGGGPVFVFVYLAANHFPWDYHYRPDLLPNSVNPENPFEIDEYRRRQEMSARDSAQFKARLGREFPNEQFLLVRFGDHQPLFAKRFIDPTLDQAEVASRILQRDPLFSPPITRPK